VYNLTIKKAGSRPSPIRALNPGEQDGRIDLKLEVGTTERL